MENRNHKKRFSIAPLRDGFIALVSGAILPLSLAPYDIWLLGLISVALLAYLLNAENLKTENLNEKNAAAPNNASKPKVKRNLWLAFLFGCGMFGSGTSWVYVAIHDFAHTPAALATIMTLMFVLGLAFVFALPFAIYTRYFSHHPFSASLGFSATWVLGEWIRSWFLTGFPWLYLGYAHADTWLGGWASILGVYGISFIVCVSATVAMQSLVTFFSSTLSSTISSTQAESYVQKIKQTWQTPAIFFAALFGIWLAGWSLNSHHQKILSNPTSTISTALVQPNIPLEVKWNPLYQDQIMDVLREESDAFWGYDLIVWPEASIPLMYHDAGFFLEEINETAIENNSGLITGILFDDAQPGVYYNSIVGVGRSSGLYFKQRLVPFGEYVPLEEYLRGLINFFNLPNSVIFPGPKNQEILQLDDKLIAPSICYEIVYPDLVARLAHDAQLLITISNDAWFGDSIGPLQHFQMARMRAMENQRSVIRATNTGISGVISANGTPLVTSKQFERDSIAYESTALYTHLTLYAQWGSWPILLICFSILGIIAIGKQLSKQKEIVGIPG